MKSLWACTKVLCCCDGFSPTHYIELLFSLRRHIRTCVGIPVLICCFHQYIQVEEILPLTLSRANCDKVAIWFCVLCGKYYRVVKNNTTLVFHRMYVINQSLSYNSHAVLLSVEVSIWPWLLLHIYQQQAQKLTTFGWK